MKVFFLVFARDGAHVEEKTAELQGMGYPYVVVCGENLRRSDVAYRPPMGKWDAVNFGRDLVPPDVDVIVLNDVDTVIRNFERALRLIEMKRALFVYCAVRPREGPQQGFYAIANPINRRMNIFALGELILIRRETFDRLVPVPPCLAEDTYLMFKALELGLGVHFCEDAHVLTNRTRSPSEEVLYKERTTLGILQALDYSSPPPLIRLFYRCLPLLAMLLRVAGENGRAWSDGILNAIRLHAKGTNRTVF